MQVGLIHFFERHDLGSYIYWLSETPSDQSHVSHSTTVLDVYYTSPQVGYNPYIFFGRSECWPN